MAWARTINKIAGWKNASLAFLGMVSLSGCGSFQGAPSFALFGAFFPGWMFCVLLGIFAAVGARAVFVATGWADVLPYQLFVCAALGLMFGLVVWLLWFGL